MNVSMTTETVRYFSKHTDIDEKKKKKEKNTI